MLGYVGATLIADACVRVFVIREAVGSDGRITDRQTRDQLVAALAAFAEASAAVTAPSQ